MAGTPNRPLAPGGVLDPRDDINDIANPDFDSGSPRFQSAIDASEAAAVNAASLVRAEPLAPSAILDARKDINLISGILDNEIAQVLGGIVSVSARDLTQLLRPDELAKAAVKLGNDLQTRGTQVVGALVLAGQRGVVEMLDQALVGANRWHPAEPAERVILEGRAPQRSVSEALTSALPFLRRNVLQNIFGKSFVQESDTFNPGTDVDGDGFISEDDVRAFSEPTGDLERFLEGYNLYTPGARYSERAAFTHEEINADSEFDADFITKKKSVPQTDKVRTFDLEKLFRTNNVKNNLSVRVPIERPLFRGENRPDGNALGQASFAGGIIPVGFPGEDEDGSLLTKVGENPADKIDDDVAYVPVTFTDVRPHGGNDGFQRSVFFRPIITSLNEDFSPEWDKKTFYGRSDQVVTYMSTIRTIFLGFELHAFVRQDVDLIFRKLNWLSSMVYPQYDNELLLKAGPVCRLRVGDVISTRDRLGVPGVIDSLSLDYSDSIWEVERGSKVPRTVRVSVSFHALHDSIIGKTPGGFFGGIGHVDDKGTFTPELESSHRAFRSAGDIDTSSQSKGFESFTKPKENG